MMQAPETRYAEGPSGLLAYKVVGTGPDIVFVGGMTSHVDLPWETEQSAHALIRFASFGRLIHFDRRGTGASDPVPIDALPSWEQWSDDLRIILDAAGSDHAALVAWLDGGPMAMLFAAAHPDRTDALVLGNTGARLLAADDYPAGIPLKDAEALHTLIREQWGSEEFVAAMLPSVVDDPVGRAWMAKSQRASASPRVVAAHFRALFELDVRAVLASIQAPTLILHRRNFPIVPLEQARYLNQHIGGSTLFELDGADAGVLGFGDASDLAVDAIQEFLTGAPPIRNVDRVLATTLFTDVVGSTGRTSELGDRRWRQLLDQHDSLIRTLLDRHGGKLIKTTGDGSLATFDGPTRAIRCARAIVAGLYSLGLQVRAGLHTGEIELRGDDVAGLAVVISERVSSLASAGQVLVSSTVRDLVVGSDVRFEDFGTHELRGVPDRWRVFAVLS